MNTKLIVTLLVLICVTSALACSPFAKVKPTKIRYAKDLPKAERLYHEKYMQIAYDLAVEKNNLFTTVIVAPNGTIACTGLNQGHQSAIFHGETVAIANCSLIHNKNTWEGYTLYTTGESCVMCQSAAMWAKFSTVVYGSSVEHMYCKKCLGQMPIESQAINALSYGLGLKPYYSNIIGGILESKTNTLYANLCGSGNEWETNPVCKRCRNSSSSDSSSDSD
eukprot:gene1935-2370_t